MNKIIKNGFTLVELITALSLLALITLITVPILTKTINKSKEKALIEQKRVIVNAAKKYALENISILPSFNEDKYTITIDDLKNSSILDDNKVLNPSTNKPMTGCVEVKYNAVKDIYTYEYTDTCKVYPAEPVLDKKMIPIKYVDNKPVTVGNSKWYDYDNKEWANAVIVKNGKYNTYANSDGNEEVLNSDIIAYLVWIPRYSYAIPNVTDKNNPPLINIKFENKDTSKSTGDAIGVNYFTHPGFTFGDKELDGIWVGKFETTGTDDAPTVLPNAASLTNQTISAQFKTAQDFKNYGISNDTHMMKNSEWAAVAYLSHSKYGNENEIRINNYWGDSKTLTGCGASTDDASETSTCDIRYGNATVYPQSTTNNVSGIFDMSGGAWEYVMGNYNNTLGSSGFTQLPEPKYYDLFDGDTYENACNGGLCKGHANYETKNWYSSLYNLITSASPWISRGGSYENTSEANIFTTSNAGGGAYVSGTFRLVISN